MRFPAVLDADSSGGWRHGVRNEHDAGSGARSFFSSGLAGAAMWSAVERSATDGAGIADHMAGWCGGGRGVIFLPIIENFSLRQLYFMLI